MIVNKVIPFIVAFTLSPLASAAGMPDGHQHGSTAHWMAPAAEAAKPNPQPASIESIQTGAGLYQQNCQSCHGADADGKGAAGSMLNPRPANLKAMSGLHPDGDFAHKIKQGRGAMPGWKHSLDDTKVWHLVNFIQSLKAEN